MNLAQFTLLIATATTITCATAFAEPAQNLAGPISGYETRTISNGFSVNSYETKSIELDGPRYVKNLVIQAQGSYGDSTVEVMVNGEVKGTLYVPGRDPSYVVTIGESTRSIQFRHTGGGNMRVLDVKATMSSWTGFKPSHGPAVFAGRSEGLSALAYQAIECIDQIRAAADPEMDETYLLPIKKKAGQVYVMASARGAVSHKTGEALEALVLQIDFAQSALDRLSSTDALFDSVVQIKSIRERIDHMLD